MDYLEAQQTQHPDQAAQLHELGDLYKKKLYDTLGKKLAALTNVSFFQNSPHLLKLYENFVKKFDRKVKPLILAQFVIAASKQCASLDEGVAFLDAAVKNLSDTKVQSAIEAKEGKHQGVLCVQFEIIRRKIALKKLSECKTALDDGKKEIDDSGGILDAFTYSQYFLAALEYHRAKDNPAEFFSNSILYLTYTPLTSLAPAQQVALAADLGRAALIGKNIYNFGELLQHPMLAVLRGTPHEWIGHMLVAFNAGDIARFQELCKQETKQDVLRENMQFLNEKLRIMTFMELVFRKPGAERTIPFKEVAAVCQVKESEVEFLLLKAFALKVVKGLIDQVEQTVRVKWVQPRVLDKGQIGSLRDRLTAWGAEVTKTASDLETTAPDLFAR